MYTQQAGHLPPGIKTASDSAVHIENVLAPPVLPKSMPRRKAGLILFPVPAETFFRAILLRILDPHGIDNRVMAPCRYNDKPLACDLIIITTPYMPSEFYGVQFPAVLGPNVIDSLDQLARRISLTIEMSGRKIKAMQYRPLPFQTTSGWYWAIPGTERPNPYSSLARPTPPNQEEGIYNSIFED